MKTPEICFMEIVQHIRKNKNTKKDDGKALGAMHMFCKLRNFEGNYMYDGAIQLNNDLQLVYFLSNQRSCVSIKHLPTAEDYQSLRTLEMLSQNYTDKLFFTYSLDVFVAGLHVDVVNQ